MKTRIIRLGNSQGIIIPKELLDQIDLSGEIEIIARQDTLVIRAVKKPRAGWAEAFKKMA